MLKKIVLGATIAASMCLAAPLQASAGDNEGCLITAGCFWTDLPTDPGGGYWTCPDPQTYMLCKEP